MDTQENHSTNHLQKICLYIAPIIAVVIHFFLEREPLQTMFSNGVFMVLLSSGYLLFIRTSGREIYNKIEHDILFWGCFSLSFLLLGIHSISSVGVLWLLVVAFAGMEGGLELSVSLHVYFMIAYVILVLLPGGDIYGFAVSLFFGFILATLFSLYRSKESTMYLAVILLAVDAVLKLVLYRLNMSALLAHGYEIAAELAGILVLVCLGRSFLKFVPDRGQASGKNMSPEEREKKVVLLKEKVRVSDKSEILEELVREDFPLILRLQEYSQELYEHSYRIAELSAKAVEVIGGNARLARAGGFYHEIGRITGEENYIEAGVALGEQFSFPEELQAVLRQHSASFELPKSVEAAVVMLSDCIISTSDYLEKNGMREKLADEKLVHSVFQNRLSKGNLKECKISMVQLEKLQTYFIQHSFEKGVSE